jgi:hypothetical protein
MAGRPLQGRDRPGYGYTIWTEDREVIELAILNACSKGAAKLRGSGFVLLDLAFGIKVACA